MKIFKQQFSNFFAKARVIAHRKLNRLVLGPLVGKMPFTAIRSLEESLYDEHIKNHIVDIIRIYEPLVARYDFPENYPLYFRRDKTFEKRYIYILKDVYVSSDSGMVWLPDGHILQESVGSLLRIMGWGGILHEPLLPTETLRTEEPIVACPPTGYFHWLFEIMPNILHALAVVPNIKILVSKQSPQYLLNALQLLLRPEEYKKRLLFSQFPVKVSHLVMPQVDAYSGFIYPNDLEKLRAAFKPKIIASGNVGKTLIYISRRLTPKRRLANEEDVERQIEPLGFNIVYCEDMSFHDQINLYSRARLIVAPHGAGLSNMVWAESPCTILEIFPSNVFNDCYARLATTLRFRYEYAVCESDKSSSGKIIIHNVLNKIHATLNNAGA